MLATAYLKSPAKHHPGPAVVVRGAERYLKQRALKMVCEQILGADADELGMTRFGGKDVDYPSVLDDLLTVSMWGDRRVVLVEDADDFVKNHRSELEKYLEKPAKRSVLVLDVKTWPSTTRLAKKVATIGLDLDCSPLKGAELSRWLAEHAQVVYEKKLSRDAAATLVELAGADLGLLDQELGKLASYVGKRGSIDTGDVQALVGGWKAETTWGMLDAVASGQAGKALQLLDKLLTAGEHPLQLFGGINYRFRMLAQATESSRTGTPLRTALAEAGVKPFNLNDSMDYLKRIGRPRAEKIYGWLLATDGDLKGNSALPDRMVLEKLLLQLSGVL